MAKISRTLWGQQFDRCWCCGQPADPAKCRHLETHEIARGVHRAKAVAAPAAWIRVCSLCHDTVGSMSIVTQLAMKKINDPECYDRVAVNRMRGRADEAVTEAEVDEAVAILE